MSANQVTWDTIKGYFTPDDIDHMKKVTGGSLDLSDCESVQHWAKQIYVAVSKQVMPPSPYDPWPQNQIDDFKTWMESGAKCPPGDA